MNQHFKFKFVFYNVNSKHSKEPQFVLLLIFLRLTTLDLIVWLFLNKRGFWLFCVFFLVKKRHEGRPRRRPQSVPTVWGRRPRRRKRLCWRRRGSRRASLERSRSRCSPRSPSAASWCANRPPRSAATPSRCACPGTSNRRASRTTWSCALTEDTGLRFAHAFVYLDTWGFESFDFWVLIQ